MKATEILKSVIREPYAWPGGYERAIITDDGGVICHDCARDNYRNMLHSTRGDYHDGWQVMASFIVYESATCEHCNKRLGNESPDSEVTEITESEYHESLNVLPPENWTQTDGFEHFHMMEYWAGTLTQQYARKGEQYLTKQIDVVDKSTWIKLSDFD